jgi:hypothetical protein
MMSLKKKKKNVILSQPGKSRRLIFLTDILSLKEPAEQMETAQLGDHPQAKKKK